MTNHKDIIFACYVYDKNEMIVAIGKSRKRDKAVRIAANKAPINNGVLTVKLFELMA